MVSLRLKITTSLILASVLSIALFAFSARQLILGRFGELAHDPVADSFMTEILAYYDYYGSWEAALTTEPLRDFTLRLRLSGELPVPVHYPEGRQPFVFYQGPGVLQPSIRSLTEGAASDETSPEIVDEPPPPYIIIDSEGMVIVSPVRADIGTRVPGLKIEYAIPIVNEDKTIGYLYSDLQAALSEQRGQYLNAITNTWWIASLIVAFLSIPFGYLLGRKLAGPIDSLDRAMRAMQPGSLEQSVPIKSRDELGLLSKSFNQMSKDLSYAYEELEKSRQKMEEMSLQDPLTLLPNRRSFDDNAALVLAQAYRHNRPCTLAMIDVDRFKQINDSYSHATGDTTLKLLAQTLRANLREVDILARYGGEEFLILFPETNLETAYKLIERLRDFIANSRWPDVDQNLRITISCGLVEVEINDTAPNILDKAMNAADKKLYIAKDRGRNRTEC